jgi:hypothetical protein
MGRDLMQGGVSKNKFTAEMRIYHSHLKVVTVSSD